MIEIFGSNSDDKMYAHEELLTDEWINAASDTPKQRGDILSGNDGDDLIVGSDQNDILFGGRGNNQIYGGDGADFIDVSLKVQGIGPNWDIAPATFKHSNFLLTNSYGTYNGFTSTDEYFNIVYAGGGDDRVHGGIGVDFNRWWSRL